METFKLEFSGCFTNETLDKLPETSGIYCVCKGQRLSNGNILPVELIYIGQAENLSERLNLSRVEDENWEDELEENEILYYKYAEVDKKDLDIVEAAMIYHHKPDDNTQCVNNFPHEEEVLITIKNGGALLGKAFFV